MDDRLQDHLHSSSALLTQAGALASGGRAYYAPFDAVRSGQVALTQKRFTGQYHETSLPGGAGLYDYGARWYDARLGHFISPDSLVSNPANPQDLNRFSYVRNNPLKYTDPTGHCPVCIFLIAAGIAFLAEGSVAEAPAGNYTDVPDNANGLLGVGLITGGAAVSIIGPAGAASVAGSLCTDGDCTNESRAGSQLLQSAQQTESVWRLPWNQRGVEIENVIGRALQLVQNYPVIDKFENGVVTSIKSLNLAAQCYQNPAQLERTVRSCITSLANWKGANWGGYAISEEQIISRELQLAIPYGGTKEQLAALQRLQQWALTAFPHRPVNLNIVGVTQLNE